MVNVTLPWNHSEVSNNQLLIPILEQLMNLQQDHGLILPQPYVQESKQLLMVSHVVKLDYSHVPKKQEEEIDLDS